MQLNDIEGRPVPSGAGSDVVEWQEEAPDALRRGLDSPYDPAASTVRLYELLDHGGLQGEHHLDAQPARVLPL